MHESGEMKRADAHCKLISKRTEQGHWFLAVSGKASVSGYSVVLHTAQIQNTDGMSYKNIEY